MCCIDLCTNGEELMWTSTHTGISDLRLNYTFIGSTLRVQSHWIISILAPSVIGRQCGAGLGINIKLWSHCARCANDILRWKVRRDKQHTGWFGNSILGKMRVADHTNDVPDCVHFFFFLIWLFVVHCSPHASLCHHLLSSPKPAALLCTPFKGAKTYLWMRTLAWIPSARPPGNQPGAGHALTPARPQQHILQGSHSLCQLLIFPYISQSAGLRYPKSRLSCMHAVWNHRCIHKLFVSRPHKCAEAIESICWGLLLSSVVLPSGRFFPQSYLSQVIR